MKSTVVLAAAVLLAASSAAADPGGQGARAACLADYQKLCQGVLPGGGRVLQCLKQHDAQLSPGCKSALTAALAARKQGDPPKAK